MHFGDFHPYYGNSFAVVVGINEYENAGTLAYAANDADGMAKILISQLGFPQDHVTILKDSKATKETIINSYLQLVDKANSPDDRVIFFFAGHGYTVEGYQGQVGYLVPTNGNIKNLASLIRWDDLTRNADLIPAKHILFILDACFSGLAFKRAIQPGNQRFLSEMLQRRARQVITAGKADQVVSDGGGPDGRNSIFTGHLIEGLKGKAKNKNGVLTANDLMHYIYENLSNDPKSEQTPHYGHIDGDGDFVFIPTTENSKDSEQDVIVDTHPERPEPEDIATTNSQQTNSFSFINGYSNPLHPNFGRNQYSNKLGITNFDDRSKEKSFSWLSLVIEPVTNRNFELNLTKLSKEFPNYKPKGSEPFEKFTPPSNKMTSINSVILYNELTNEPQFWSKYIRIEKSGNIELCDAYNSFISFNGMRTYRYVQIIGLIWQFMFFAKHILAEHDYNGGVNFLVNLIGAKDTILADFSNEAGEEDKKWAEPGARNYFSRAGLLDLTCPDLNLQMKYNLILSNINQQSSKQTINDVADKLGLAYNHQSEPRCFNYNTDIFPWRQFFNGQHY